MTNHVTATEFLSDKMSMLRGKFTLCEAQKNNSACGEPLHKTRWSFWNCSVNTTQAKADAFVSCIPVAVARSPSELTQHATRSMLLLRKTKTQRIYKKE